MPQRYLSSPAGALNVPAISSAAGGERTPLLSVVVPTFNEVRNIEPFLQALDTSLRKAVGFSYELIVVDDNSPDGTWERAQGLLHRYPELRVMRRIQERGLSSAVVRGWQVAQGDYLATINSDFQHPPAIFPEMLQRIRNADLVVATRYSSGRCTGNFPMHRHILTKCAWHAGNLMLPEVFRRVSDPLSGYYLLRRQTIQGIDLRPSGFKTLIEVLGRGRVSDISEVSYNIEERKVGHSKVRARHGFEYLIQLARLRGARASQ